MQWTTHPANHMLNYCTNLNWLPISHEIHFTPIYIIALQCLPWSLCILHSWIPQVLGWKLNICKVQFVWLFKCRYTFHCEKATRMRLPPLKIGSLQSQGDLKILKRGSKGGQIYRNLLWEFCLFWRILATWNCHRKGHLRHEFFSLFTMK